MANDLSSLLGSFISADSIEGMSAAAGVSSDEVQKVLDAALPSLLGGALNQANNAETSEGFDKALADHAKDDISDLASFVQKADTEDGQKIVQHLLGGESDALVEQVSERAGLSSNKTLLILALVAPLLMSALGQQTQTQQQTASAGTGSILGSLLGGLGGSSAAASTASSGLLGGGLLSGLLGGGTQQQSSQSSGGLLDLLTGLLK